MIFIKAIKLIFIFMLIWQFCCPAFAGENISACSAAVIEQSSGKLLFSKNADKKMKPASTTKILTAIIALEKCEPTELVVISSKASKTEGSSMYLEPNEKITMLNIVYGLMLNSGNDAAVAIAEHISGSTEKFSQLMNKKSMEIGAKNSNFITPNGLDDDNHYTTAYDLALITAYALNNSLFREIVSTQNKVVETSTGTKKYLHNHNKLLTMYNGCGGVKTGFTKASGRTLVSSAKRDGMELISVTLNAPDDWNDHIKMLNYGFENYELMTFVSPGQICCRGYVKNGVKQYARMTSKESVTAVVNKQEQDKYALEYSLKEIEAPVSKGNVLGKAIVKKDGKIISQTDLYSTDSIEKIIIKKKYSDILKLFFYTISFGTDVD